MKRNYHRKRGEKSRLSSEKCSGTKCPNDKCPAAKCQRKNFFSSQCPEVANPTEDFLERKCLDDSREGNNNQSWGRNVRGTQRGNLAMHDLYIKGNNCGGDAVVSPLKQTPRCSGFPARPGSP